MGILTQILLGMVISFYLAQCMLCTLLMLTPTSSWRLHNKFNEPGTSQEDPYGLKRMSRNGPRVMVTRSELAPALVEDEYADERGSDIADRGMMMGLKKRSWTSQAERGEAKHHPRTCGPCARTEAGINGLEEMVYRMLVESGDI